MAQLIPSAGRTPCLTRQAIVFSATAPRQGALEAMSAEKARRDLGPRKAMRRPSLHGLINIPRNVVGLLRSEFQLRQYVRTSA